MWWGAYVGIPFGDGPGELTCWGLVRRVYADRLGIDLPAYGEILARDLMQVARRMEAGKDDGWCEPDPTRAFDVVLMRAHRGPALVSHVGLLTSRTHVLHVEAATAACVVPLTHYSIAGRVLGYRRKSP